MNEKNSTSAAALRYHAGMIRPAFLLTALLALANPAAGQMSGSAATPALSAVAVQALPARAFLAPATAPAVQAALNAAPAGTPAPLTAAVPREVAAQVLTLIRERRPSPPRAARLLALTLIAVNDTERAAQGSRRAVNTDLAARIAAGGVLAGLYAGAPVSVRDAMHAGTPASRLGEAVAAQVLAWAAHDDADRPVPPTPGTGAGAGLWAPLTGQNPLEPGWGQVKPIGLTAQTLPRVAPPPAWNSAEFAADRQAFQATQRALTPADVALGAYWAAGPGTVTPAGMWMEAALSLGARHALSGADTARLLATTATAEHDAFITCWEAKFRFNVARPQAWLAEQFPGWTPDIATPPFPSYPSGHATVSGAAATVLAAAFPQDAARLRADAQAAAHSRVVGGIHWTLDGVSGLDAGQRVAQALLGGGESGGTQ